MPAKTGSTKDRLRELETLATIGRVISSSLYIDEVYENFVDLVQDIIPFDRIAVVFVDSESNQFVEAVVRDLTASNVPPDPPIPSKGTFIGRVAEQQKTEVLQHRAEGPNSARVNKPASTHGMAARFASLLVVPLLWRGTTIGLLTLRSVQPEAYGPPEVELGSQIGNQISGAIATQGAYEHELALGEARRQSAVLAAENSYLHELNESKTRLLATVSHELKTPLAVIRGFADALVIGASEALSDTQVTHLDAIIRNSDRLNRMITSLLDASQLESGTLVLTRTRFDLCGLLKEIIDQFTITTQGKNQRLEQRLPSELVDIEADSDRLVQIVTNLLDNASKYSPAGATIQVAMESNDDRVLIRVKDDGMGIPEEEQDRVFERFERGSHVDVARQRGLGLGLSLVSLLVSLHGGNIELESKPGSGTEVTVTLPPRQGL